MGRPKLELDEGLIKSMAEIHCTLEEIASVVGCSVDTLERRYLDIIKDARNGGRMSLRRKQFEVAMSGNPQMLIWLGKQELGQTDKVMETGSPKAIQVVYQKMPQGKLTEEIDKLMAEQKLLGKGEE